MPIATLSTYAVLPFLWFPAAIVYAETASIKLESCPVTLGTPRADQEWKDVFMYGGDVLSVQLYVDGWWHGHGSEDNYRSRLWWSSEGYDGLTDSVPVLAVSGRRLDAEAGPAHVSSTKNATDGEGNWNMLVVVEFPSAGCWEITGEYGGQLLSFVVLVGEHDHIDASDA